MAEGALFDLARNVLQLLGSIIVKEVKLASSVETEIENLTNIVSTIHAVLLDAEKQSSHSHQIKDWLSKLKDVLHDADDLLDDFSTQVMRRKVMTKKDRETYSFVLEDEVIGREDDKKEIMERLFDDNVVENISIIPIVGFGGLGKTTLAQLVYNDENVQTKFEIKLWVCISDVFDVQRIVKEMLEQLTKRKHEESLEILQNQLREKLNGKKYLLVLDDLWNENSNKWLLLKNLLICGARGSRILVTTRSESVARIIGAAPSHALRGLPEEKAWSLFVKVAFEQGKLQENEVRISLGKEIMGKCGGVPLAIRTIASLLSTKASENDWRYFRSSLLLEITQEEGKENDILSTLKLSYNHLPSYLKQCFAYCRLFPKDYKIDVTTLINLWAAQGFIKLSDSKQRVEDVGREYFMVLLRRCFFQDVQKDEYDIISYCKMHDLMHDLAILVAGMESTMLTSSGEYNDKKVRHVSFDLEDSSRKLSIFNIKGLKIRTILVASRVWEKLVKLKECLSLKELPRGLENLVNLRHLDISGCYRLTHMPLGLGHLTSLEILTMFVVRQGGSKASSCGWYKKKQGRSGGGLSELKELSNLGGRLDISGLGHGEDDTVECKATNMKDKQHLQHLTLYWDDKWDDGETECYDEMSLEGLQPHPNLKSLLLSYYMGVRIPSWVSSLTNLVSFKLYYNKRLPHLPSLNQLPFLKVVFLGGMEALEYISDEDSVSNVLGASSSSSSSKTPFFPSLSSLEIWECPKLKGWWRNSDDDDDNEPHHLLLPSFPPSLSKLTIMGCPNLTSMPLIPDLILKMRDCPLLRLHEANREDCPK
ncbi:hypothetical protein RGQ29_032385 [Quercus rubra]|uniref:Disease resistance protein RGA3 n=1 Tax=Quercus rubra TaxID=3512 RepID=A0AAN7I6G4_QUERU|nr:hypothetical protein RGQ29_032385 [Quercus rubra]